MKSVLMARTWESISLNFAIPDWYAVSSCVQPPVNAAGKNARITIFLPRKSDSLISFPLVFIRPEMVKSGAVSPIFRLVLGGAFWANIGMAPRAMASKAGILTLPSVKAEGTTAGPDGASKFQPKESKRGARRRH